MNCKSCKVTIKQGFVEKDGWLCTQGMFPDTCWQTDERMGRHKKKKKKTKNGTVAER